MSDGVEDGSGAPVPSPDESPVVLADVPAGGRRFSLVAASVLAVIVVALVAVLATRSPSEDRQTRSPLLGKIAPSVQGTTLTGSKVNIDDDRGRWVMVNFFASWCTPCMVEHPELTKFDEEHRAAGDAVLVGVTYDNTKADAKAFFARQGGTWPVIYDPEDAIAVEYGVAKVPETFVVSPDGVVVEHFAGGVTQADLDNVIKAYEGPGGVRMSQVQGAMPSEGPIEPDPDPAAPTVKGRGSRSPKVRRWSWIVILALVLVALVRNEVASGTPRSDAERVHAIAAQMKCPVCKSQSVANSDSAAASAIKVEVARRVAEGQSDGAIRAAIAATYGADVQLTPSASGFAGLVWILPVVALIVAIAALSATFARWRRSVGTEATPADQALVAEALRQQHQPPSP